MFDVAPARPVCSAMIVGRCDVCGAALFLSADGEAIGYLCDHEEE